MSLPTQWFTNATTSVNAAQSCGELQTIVNEVFATLTPLQAELPAQITLLNTLMASPGNLADCINWISAYISFVSGPITQLTTQITELTAAIASLTTAINTRASQLGCSSIVIP